MLGPSFIQTGFFFHQAHIVDVKGWTLLQFAALYPGYAAMSVINAIVCGMMIDRLGSLRILPLYQAPMIAALCLMSVVTTTFGGGIAMLLIGVTTGFGVTLMSAIWAELYGTRHLGAIKALVAALMVFSSALGPGVIGVLVDLGVGVERQFIWLAVYAVLTSLLAGIAIARRRASTDLAVQKP